MAPVSSQSFTRALQHAETTQEHGQAFERMARSLEGKLLSKAQAEVIELAGQQIQQHGNSMSALAAQALQDNLPAYSQYVLIHWHQREAVLLYLGATKVLLQANRAALL